MVSVFLLLPKRKYILNLKALCGLSKYLLEDSSTSSELICAIFIWRCDRILWHGGGLQQLSYVRGESRFSDHRPVFSMFLAEVESVHSRLRKTSYSSTRIEVEELLPYSHGYTELCFFWSRSKDIKPHCVLPFLTRYTLSFDFFMYVNLIFVYLYGMLYSKSTILFHLIWTRIWSAQWRKKALYFSLFFSFYWSYSNSG